MALQHRCRRHAPCWKQTGWKAPDLDHHPTGAEIVDDYLEPLAAVPAIRDALMLNARVVAVGRRGFDKVRSAGRDDVPFIVTVAHAAWPPINP